MTSRVATGSSPAPDASDQAITESATSEPDRRPGRPRSVEADSAILAAALRLLADHGYDGMTMEGVASEAGVGKATVYRRWGSKVELILDAIRSLKPMVTPPDSGDTRLDLVELLAHSISWRDDSEYSHVVAALMAEMQRNPDLAEVYRNQLLAPRRLHAIEILARGVSRGELRSDLDLELVLDQLIGPIFYRSMITGGALDRSTAEAIVDQLFAGIAGSGAG